MSDSSIYQEINHDREVRTIKYYKSTEKTRIQFSKPTMVLLRQQRKGVFRRIQATNFVVGATKLPSY